METKSSIRTSLRIILSVVTLAGTLPLSAAGFSDTFESGLSQWTGKSGSGHHGIIVNDPLASGHGKVLSFSDVGYGGDIFSANQISLSGPLLISFDYLGFLQPGSNPTDLGGFLGVAHSLHPIVEGSDIVWYAGTTDNYPGLLTPLVDDGAWHHYEIAVNGDALGSFRLTLEDFSGSGGSCGDVYFDNLSVTTVPNQVPEPTIASMTLLGALALVLIQRQRA